MPKVTLNGQTAFQLYDLSYGWKARKIGAVSLDPATPVAEPLELSLTGKNWSITALDLAVAGLAMKLTDATTGTARSIGWLSLGGGGSEITLKKTAVRFITGFGAEDHKITLGAGRTSLIELYDGHDHVIGGTGRIAHVDLGGGDDIFTAGRGWVGKVDLGVGDDRITAGQGARIESLFLGHGVDRVTLTSTASVGELHSASGSAQVNLSGHSYLGEGEFYGTANVTLKGSAAVGDLRLYDGALTLKSGVGLINAVRVINGRADLTVGLGGAENIVLGGDNANHKVSVQGWLGSFLATGNSTLDLRVQSYAEVVRTGDGADLIATGDKVVGAIRTMGGNDRVTLGTGGANFVDLGDGADVLVLQRTQAGVHIHANGGRGTDSLEFSGWTQGVVLDLGRSGAQQLQRTGQAQTADYALTGFENVTGTAQSDAITGDWAANHLSGGRGHDTLIGAGGDDTLRGGKGNDVLTGGTGADVFVFAKADGTDRITDFERGQDQLQMLGAKGMGQLSFVTKGEDVEIRHGTTRILVEDITRDQLMDADNFLF